MGCATGSVPPPEPVAARYAAAIRARDPDGAQAIAQAAGRPAEVRTEGAGMRPVRLVSTPGGWRLAALPITGRSASIDEAVAAYLQQLAERDPDAMLILLGDRREAVVKEIAERTEALRTRRGLPELRGTRARVRVADSWWLLVESAQGGWKVVGSQP